MHLKNKNPVLHIDRADWTTTPDGTPRGYIQPQQLRELWFHTGTVCNLSCSFCLEGSMPGNNRLRALTLSDAKPFIDEAMNLGVEQFSFTGGEPFVVKETVSILHYALERAPCLVLTNATEPLLNRLHEVIPLKEKPFPLSFRISLDYPDPEKHERERGRGNFQLALKTMAYLHENGFHLSVARLGAKDENTAEVNAAYAPFFKAAGLPEELPMVIFPDFHEPGTQQDVPHITEHCMTALKTESERDAMMCNFSKMIVKKDDQARVLACTLVDDDEDFDLGPHLSESMKIRIMLKHHRCFTCFANGASCSEI